MNLRNKKELAARTLRVGKDRVVFLESRIPEIKEALTKQDIKDLKNNGAIIVKEKNGRKKVEKKKRRGPGSFKKKVDTRKQKYVKLTRKLRAYVADLKEKGKLTPEETNEIRKKIRNKDFKSKAQLKTYVGGLKK